MQKPAVRAAMILLVLAMLGWHLHLRVQGATEMGVFDRALITVTGPIQGGITGIFRAVGGFVEDYVLLLGVTEENASLRAELAARRLEVAELGELRQQNDRLRLLNALRQRSPGRTMGATVVARGTSDRFRTLRINRGTADGLRPGQPVLSAGGAVGQVLRAANGYSDVMLLTDGLSAAGVIVQESRLRAVAAGDGDQGMTLAFVRRSEEEGLEPGYLVVTSGDDGIFPAGVPVGRIGGFSVPESGLFLDVELKPIIELARIEEVVVVLDPGEGPFHFPSVDGSDRGSVPHSGPGPGAEPRDDEEVPEALGALAAPPGEGVRR